MKKILELKLDWNKIKPSLKNMAILIAPKENLITALAWYAILILIKESSVLSAYLVNTSIVRLAGNIICLKKSKVMASIVFLLNASNKDAIYLSLTLFSYQIFNKLILKKIKLILKRAFMRNIFIGIADSLLTQKEI